MTPDEPYALVLKTQQSGESFLRLWLLRSSDECVCVLYRLSKKKAAPDLFDTIEAQLETGNKGGLFLKEWVTHRRRLGIAKNYRGLCCASEFANFLLLNLRHAESFTDLYTLARSAYDAWDGGKSPQCVLFKAYYKLLLGEGYPVREEWLANLPLAQQNTALHYLKTPPEEIKVGNEHLDELCLSLRKWIAAQAEWQLP